MKLLNLEIENFKRLKVVNITPGGNVVQLTGDNDQGKTSVLDAIEALFAGGKAIPGVPIRVAEGEEIKSARITGDIGDYVVTRRFTPSGTTLTIENADGASYKSPQAFIDGLGMRNFDPMEFTRRKPDEQLAIIKGLVKLDVDVDALDRANAADFAERTAVNREVKALGTRVDAIRVPADLPETAPDAQAIVAELEGVGTHNGEIEARKARRANVAASVQQHRARAQSFRDAAIELRRQADEQDKAATVADDLAQQHQAQLDAAGPLPEHKDPEPIRARLAAAQAEIEGIRIRDEKKALMLELAAKEREATALTDAMAERTKQKVEAIAKAEMPVPGLSFGDGHLILNGIPFEQASKANQIRVATAIAMAGDTKLRILRITDGSLLGSTMLKVIAEMAEARDYQVWIEQVNETGKVGIVIEDGTVLRDNTKSELEPELETEGSGE